MDLENLPENDRLLYIMSNIFTEFKNIKNKFTDEEITLTQTNLLTYQDYILINIKKLNKLSNGLFASHENFFSNSVIDNNLAKIDMSLKSEIHNTTELNKCMSENLVIDQENKLINPLEHINYSWVNKDLVIGEEIKYLNPFDNIDYCWTIKDIIEVNDTQNMISFYSFICVYINDITKTIYFNISFRGTSDIINIIMNTQLKPIKFTNKIDGSEFEYFLHNGFSKSFNYIDKNGVRLIDLIFTKLLNVIESYNHLNYKKEFIISGHSLGAALSTIFSLYLFSDEISQKYFNTNIFSSVKIFNYGQPKITSDNTINDIFTLLSNQNKVKYYSFVNNFDIVSTVSSLYMFNYKHAFEHTYFYSLTHNSLFKISTSLIVNSIFMNLIDMLILNIIFGKYSINKNKEIDELLCTILYQELNISIFSHYIDNYKYFLTNYS